MPSPPSLLDIGNVSCAPVLRGSCSQNETAGVSQPRVLQLDTHAQILLTQIEIARYFSNIFKHL
jgi:hypothetical protein